MVGEQALKSFVRRVRRRWFLREWSRVFTWTALTAALAVVAAGTIAQVADLRGAALAALAAAVLAVGLGAFVVAAWPLRRRPGDRRVARFVEERCPDLEDRLASATDLLDRPGTSPFDALVVAQAARHANAIDLDRIVPSRTLRRRGLQLVVAAGMLAAALGLFREEAWRAVWTLRYTALPPQLALEIEPGDTRIVERATVTVRARVAGAPQGWPVPTPILLASTGGDERVTPMNRRSGGFEADLADIRAPLTYRVEAGSLVSRSFSIAVRRTPRVERVDLTYTYPAFTGLASRVEEDGGDIFAPAGTRVRLHVRAENPIEAGEIVLFDGRRVALGRRADRVLEGDIVVAAEGSYRVALTDPEGLSSDGDTEYFIRVMDDRPPDVRLMRPESDRRVTRLEEVVFEARADDDHGVERLDLVVAVRGSEERVVPLHRGAAATSVSGAHTLFLEDLDVRPGDFVTYYARARDVSRGKRSTEARSDIFFLEVRPFTEEFEAAQSQAFTSGGGGSFDDLAAQQKNVVIATWKLERRAAAGRSRADIEAVARAQAEVRRRAAALASRTGARRPARPQSPVEEQAGQGAGVETGSPMQLAVAAMGRAQAQLEALDTRGAVPHEMEALNQLLRAQAEARRTQVARQQSGGGRGSQTGNQDLSALFDRELQRQQQTNYENRPGGSQGRPEKPENDPLEKLRELARRQDDLSRRQQELARRRDQLSPEEARRQLERLTREQEELRRRAEQLARAMTPQHEPNGREQNGEQSSGTSQAVREAAGEMREAAGDLQQGHPGQAGSRGAKAADRLRDAERQAAANEPDARRRTAGDLQLDLQQLAQAQRRIASDVAGAQGTDAWRRLSAEQDRVADAAERAQRKVRDLSAGSPAGDPARKAARALQRERVGERLRSAARQLGEMSDGAEERGGAEGKRLARTAGELADALERAARGLSTASGRDAEAQRLSERLARARGARERLAEIERRIQEEVERAAGEATREGDAASRSGDRAPATPSADALARGETGSQPGERAGRADMQRLQEEYGRRLQEAREALSDTQTGAPDAAEGFSTPTAWEPSRSAPGTESFKQDFAAWGVLRRDVSTALERLEATLSARLAERASRERLSADADDNAPEAYRRQLARYYEALTKRERP